MQKKHYKTIFILGVLLLGSALFGANTSGNAGSVLDELKNFFADLSDIIPLLGKLALTLFAWLCVLGVPIGSYFMAYRQFKKNDERNETDTSGAMTHAKASGLAFVGLVMGLMLFQLVFINGMGVDTAIGGGTFGEVLLSVLGLSF